jgi:arylsulfatase A-like enzyme
MMDFVPTFAKLANTPSPKQEIDGCDIRDLLFAKIGAKSPYDERGFFYYEAAQLQAVRAGSWKLYLPLKSKAGAGKAAAKGQALALYDVRTDLGEEREVSSQHPEVVTRLLELAEHARDLIGDEDKHGRGQREAGWVESPRPLLLQSRDQ